MKLAPTIVCGAAVAFSSPIASARGVSPYLPLNLSPAIERQIERVLILAGKPVMRRPIAAAVVLDALPSACQYDRAACEQVRRYLQSYMGTWGVTALDTQLAYSTGDGTIVLPNGHGESSDSEWRVTAHAYYQPSDYFMVNLGGVAYDGEATPTGSYLSLGWEWAQLDIGFRDHWLSPLTDSASLISTEAPTMPSVTLSNYQPISGFGINYEFFFAEMSEQQGILYGDTTTDGRPRLAGMQIGFEPVVGYAIAASRITQYGGGARNEGLVSQFLDVMFKTNNDPYVQGTSAESGNRVGSLSSSILFSGRVPFAVRAEYAGEDNTYSGPYRLGATNFSLGIDFPVLWRHLDLTVEVSEWQNVWYIHHLYPQGLTNEGRVIGHWFGDQRTFGDAIGGHSAMLRGGWQLPNGAYAQATYRTLALDERWAFANPHRPYETMHLLGVGYFTSWNGFAVRAQVEGGRDVFGESFARVSAAFDFARNASRLGSGGFEPSPSSDTEIFVDAGLQYSRVREYPLLSYQKRVTSSFEPDYHFGIGARRRVSQRNDIGVRLELDGMHGHSLMSLRAVDYRFRLGKQLALGAFFGVGRYDIELPAYGYYFGAGMSYRDLLPGWDLNFDYRHYDKITRDKGLPSDPESNPGMPRRAIDIDGFGLFVSKRW